MKPTLLHLIKVSTVSMLFACGLAQAQVAGPALSVDAAADQHAINPDIYGMAYPDAALAREIHLPINRWGGDATTRYNWKVDTTNAGDDWFFMAGSANSHPVASAGPDTLVTQAKADGGRVLLTMPIIDYINSAVEWNCSYPVSIFGRQQKVNPYVHPTIDGKQTDAGNGRTRDGKPIVQTKEQILRINIPNTPEFQRGWVQHLTEKFGAAAKGGVAAWELDNEPGGWNNTHRDVHPGNTGHDELVSRSIAYASMIKSVDPTAMVIGPGDFMNHYQGDGVPGDGSKEHGGLGQGNYYLQQFHDYEQKNGKRILDYFDEHYYPLGQDGETEDTTLECTRSLWDPTYVEKNWVGKYQGAKELIPKFHRWVDQYYPGTKVSVSEYGWGGRATLIGALAEADVLGIFGRERLDMACMFGPPLVADPQANAFRIYLNYDGHGSKYGDTWVKSASENQGKVSIYGALRSSDHALTLVIINKTNDDVTSQVSLAGFKPAASGKVFRYSAAADLKAIVPEADQPVTATGFSAALPTKSVTIVVIPQS